MDDALRTPVAKTIRKFLVKSAKTLSREDGYKRPHAIVLVTDHKAGEVVVGFDYRPKAPIDVKQLTEVARISTFPEWPAARDPFLAAKPTADDLASIAALALILIRQSGAVDEFSPAFPCELLAIAQGETVEAARKRAKEIQDEIDAGEEEEEERG